MNDPDRLTEDEYKAVLWAIDLGLRYDDGFSFPRDQNRVILQSARDRITSAREKMRKTRKEINVD